MLQTHFIRTFIQFYKLFLSAFLVGASVVGAFSLVSITKNDLGWSGSAYSAIFMSSSFMAIIASYNFARITKIRSFMLTVPFGAVCVAVVLGLIFFVESSYALWFLWGVVDGIFITLIYLTMETDLSHNAAAKVQARAFTLYSLMFCFGAVVTPFIVSLNVDYAQYFIILCLVLLVVIYPKRFSSDTSSDHVHLRDIGGFIKRAPFLWSLAFLGGVYGESLNAFIIPMGISQGFSEERAVLLISSLMLGSALLQYPLSSWIDRGWRRGRLAMILVATLCTLATWQLFSGYYTAVFAVVCVLGGFAGLIAVAALSILSTSFASYERASAVGLSAMFFGFGNVIGSLLLGLVLDTYQSSGVIILLAILTLASLTIGVMRHKERMVFVLLRKTLKRTSRKLGKHAQQRLMRARSRVRYPR